MTKGSALLKKLAAKKNKKEAPKAVKKDSRPVLTLEAAVADILRDYVPASIIAAKWKSRSDKLKEELKREVYEEILDLVWKHKIQPTNPNMEATSNHNGKDMVDVRSMFMVKEPYKVQVPAFDEDKETIEEAMVRTLVEVAGIKKKNAEKLVEVELDFTPITTTDWTAMLHGRYAGSKFAPAPERVAKVANKLMEFFSDPSSSPLKLNDDEREIIEEYQETKQSCKVLSGFLDRVCYYCESREQLGKVVSLISPELAVKGADFGVSDKPGQSNKRLLKLSDEVLTELLNNSDDND